MARRTRPSIAGCAIVSIMPRKPTPPPDDPEQSKRFIDIAREVEAETPSPNFERVFRKVAEKPKRPTPKAGSRDGP
jgi:hypothetical protein